MIKNYLNAFIFGTAIVIASIFLGNSYANRNSDKGEIQVTGLGKTDFTSDLIVWEGKFRTENTTLKEAYRFLEQDKNTINEYLISKGVPDSIIVFSAVKTHEKTIAKYSEDGEYKGEVFDSYQLVQSLQIESNEVKKIENISREITELLNRGVQFYSESPRYYYTKLADLKIEMISRATEDARIRAENISENSGGTLGNLQSAKMGVFQITGQNSKENYSWGGTFNTHSKNKTASITMKLVYEVK